MNVYCNDSKLVRLFLVVLWSSVHSSLGSSPSGTRTQFSKVFVDDGSLQVMVPSQQIRSAIDCARACLRRQEEEPKCEGWRFDSHQSLCHLHHGPIYQTSDTINGTDMYRLTLNKDIYPPPPIPESPSFKCARDSSFRYGSYHTSSYVTMTYYQAVVYCNALGAYLLHINGTWEYNVLIVTGVANTGAKYWLGAFKSHGNWISQKYRKSLDPLVWTWGPKQPSDAPNEDCAVIDVYLKVLFNRGCDTQQRTICENHEHP